MGNDVETSLGQDVEDPWCLNAYITIQKWWTENSNSMFIIEEEWSPYHNNISLFDESM